MRKFNAALTAVIMLLFIAHAVFGSFQMLGITGAVLEHLARGMAVLVILHALIGVKLTIDTLKTQKEAGVSYFKENKLFWIRRISGFGVMLFLCFHMFAFGGKNANGVYRLYAFTGFKLVANLLL
ncbi:MAG: pilus assembly protein PilX, partial [Clostridia bacterium]|nr:pilus assembly protein PilX [Clostridia bacterium]